MTLEEELRKTHKDINAFGVVEGEAERYAQFASTGGLWYRFFMWIARMAREGRMASIEHRDAILREMRDWRT